jgi:hypothetical protein
MTKLKTDLKQFNVNQQLESLLEELQTYNNPTGNKLSKEECTVAKLQLVASHLIAEEVLQECSTTGRVDSEFCKERIHACSRAWERNIRSFATEIMRTTCFSHRNFTIH